VIVIDNGSLDASRVIAEHDTQIKVLVENERGSYAARNLGIAEARGALIVFLDPDCIPGDDWLQNIAAAMFDPAVLVVLGRRCLPPLSPSLSLLEAYENEKDEYVINRQMETLCYGYTNNMAVRRKLFEDLGPFLKIPRGADTIFVRRVVDTYSSDVVCYCPDVVVTHLEISSVAAYYRKVFLYGRHRYYRCQDDRSQSGAPKCATTSARLRKAVRNRRFSTLEAVHLLCLLVC